MMRTATCLLIGALLLTGCSVPGRAPSTETFTLSLEPAGRSLDERGPVLEVAEPQARPGFATTGMAYREQPFELAYFAYNEWAAPPPKMLQPLLVEAMESAGAFSAVIDGPQRLGADRRLETELLYLIQDFTGETSHLEMAVRAQIIDMRSEEVIATRTFRTSQPAPSDDAYGGVVAANRALKQLLPELIQLSTTGLEAAQEGSPQAQLEP